MSNSARSKHRNIQITELGLKMLKAIETGKMKPLQSPLIKAAGTPNSRLPKRLWK
jgi:hypothetical protein